MRQKINSLSKFFYRPDLGMLLVRVVAGLIFIHHGWMKLDNVEAMRGFFTGMLGLDAFWFYATVFTELAGGMMLVLGVAARAAGVALGIVALMAIHLAIAPQKGALAGEFEWLLVAVSFGVALAGAGGYRLVDLFEYDRAKD
jgi:putative oxidoreductase